MELHGSYQIDDYNIDYISKKFWECYYRFIFLTKVRTLHFIKKKKGLKKT